jgi:hypothetical protein
MSPIAAVRVIPYSRQFQFLFPSSSRLANPHPRALSQKPLALAIPARAVVISLIRALRCEHHLAALRRAFTPGLSGLGVGLGGGAGEGFRAGLAGASTAATTVTVL